jgi:hypothetical protein
VVLALDMTDEFESTFGREFAMRQGRRQQQAGLG